MRLRQHPGHAGGELAKSGTVTAEDEVMEMPGSSGTLTFTVTVKHKEVASGSLHIDVTGCLSRMRHH